MARSSREKMSMEDDSTLNRSTSRKLTAMAVAVLLNKPVVTCWVSIPFLKPEMRRSLVNPVLSKAA
jgi:hypothetical protein